MIQYKDWAPTQFDPKGILLPDRQDWYVAPVSQTRDSEPLSLSNFAAALNILGDESETLEVHRFGHWGPGWIEIILVHPSRKDEIETMEESLSDYPVLDESDFSERKDAEYRDSWNSYGCCEFVAKLRKEFDLNQEDEGVLDDCPGETLQQFYESLIPSGDYYIIEGSGATLRIDNAVKACTTEQIRKFLEDNSYDLGESPDDIQSGVDH
jgi:hypothetical protein